MGLGGMGDRARTCGRTLKGANYQPGAMTGMWAQGYVGAPCISFTWCESSTYPGTIAAPNACFQQRRKQHQRNPQFAVRFASSVRIWCQLRALP